MSSPFVRGTPGAARSGSQGNFAIGFSPLENEDSTEVSQLAEVGDRSDPIRVSVLGGRGAEREELDEEVEHSLRLIKKDVVPRVGDLDEPSQRQLSDELPCRLRR